MANPSGQPKSDAELRLAYKKIDALANSFKAVCMYGWPVACMYFVYKIFLALAGKATFASFASSLALSIFGNDKMMKTIYLIVTGGSIAYGVGERRLRRRATKRYTDRPRQLEQAIHPKRTSSGLTPEGRTRPEDR